jgi:hypothetical protein
MSAMSLSFQFIVIAGLSHARMKLGGSLCARDLGGRDARRMARSCAFKAAKFVV